MLVSRFLKQLQDYGPIRLFTSPDIKWSIGITLLLFITGEVSCYFQCIRIENTQIVSRTTPLLTSLLSFVIVGLSIVVSFTDEEFLSKISELNIYQNVLFIFLFNIILITVVTLLSIVLPAYNRSANLFFPYVFLFLWSVFSVISMMQLVVNIGLNKAEYEKEKNLD